MENVRAVLARLLVMTFEIFMFQVTSNTRVLCTVPSQEFPTAGPHTYLGHFSRRFKNTIIIS
jgi:hypothetical protein